MQSAKLAMAIFQRGHPRMRRKSSGPNEIPGRTRPRNIRGPDSQIRMVELPVVQIAGNALDTTFNRLPSYLFRNDDQPSQDNRYDGALVNIVRIISEQESPVRTPASTMQSGE
jgi:hypothetical protein